MAPPATARRSSTARPLTGPPQGAPRRPPLRVFEPAPRRRSAPRAIRRSTMWLSGIVIVGSLLAVVVGDALTTQGQVSLSNTERQVADAVALQKQLQIDVAQKAAPPVVVQQAMKAGLVIPTSVVYLPRVPLDVPLPMPKTTPAPAPVSSTTTATTSSTTASTTGGSQSASNGSASSATATTTPAQR